MALESALRHCVLVLFVFPAILQIECWNYGNSEVYSPLDLSPKYLSDVEQRSGFDLTLTKLPYCDGQLSVCRDRTLGYLLLAGDVSPDGRKANRLKPRRTFDLHGGGDIAVQCANKCSTLQRTPTGYRRCVAYSYDYSNNRCYVYDRIQLDRNWKEQLLNQQRMPRQLQESDDVVFAISVPQVKKFNRQTWIETQEVPEAKSYLGKIESPFNDCQRCSKFGCTFFSYQTSERKCFYYPNDRPNYESDDDEDGDEQEEQQLLKMKTDYVTLYRLPDASGELREHDETELISHNHRANNEQSLHNQNHNQNNNEQDESERDQSSDSEIDSFQTNEQQLACYEDGFHVNPNDCSKFYRCHAGFRFDFECPAGTLYNHMIKTCDHSSKVDCGSQMKARIQAYSPPACQGLHAHYFSHPDCTKFYQCNLGVLFAFDCAPGTHFNAETGICDYPSVAGCLNRQSSNIVSQPDDRSQEEPRPQSKAPKHHQRPPAKQPKVKSRLQPAQIRAPKPRPVQESWVEYEPEDRKPKSPATSKAKKTQSKVESLNDKFERCTVKSKTPCTLSNYDWLHLPDTEFEGQSDDQQQHAGKPKSVKKTLNPMSSEGMDECHELCLDYQPEQGLSCVAYSYNNQSGKCELFGELVLPHDWQQDLKHSTPDSPPDGFRHSPGTNSRIHLKEPQIVLGQWLVSPNIPDRLGPRTGRNVVVSDYRPVPVNVKIKHFIDCLNACAKQPKCAQFVYNSIDKQCLTKVKDSDEKNRAKKKDDMKTTYKSGWVAGRMLSDIVDKSKNDKDAVRDLVTKNAFMMQNDGELLDLLEQYKLDKSNEPLLSLSTGEHKHLNPIETVSLKTPEECEERCAQTYEPNDQKDHVDQAKKRKKREQADGTEAQKKHCKFVTIERHLFAPKPNITCSLYAEDLAQTEMALLWRDLQKQASHVSDTNKLIGSVFGTKPLERSKRQAQKNRFIPTKEHFEIVSYPKQVEAAAVPDVHEYFRTLKDDRFKTSGLVSIGSLVEIPNRDYCLRYCLKQWQEPEAPFDSDIQCHALSLAFNHESSDYTCTFYDRPEHNQTAGPVFYQLTQILSEQHVKKHVAKAFQKTTPNKFQLEQVSHYQPIQEFPNVQDAEACLKGCHDTWKTKDGSFSRCRLVLVNTTQIQRSDRTFLKPRFDCAFFDLQMNLNDNNAAKEQIHQARVFHKQKNGKDFDEIASTLTQQILEAVEEQTKAFFHHSKAASSNECLDTCRNIQNLTNINKKCNLVVVKKIMHKSPVTQRSVAQFECAFYENALQINFHDGSESMHRNKDSAKAVAFKVVKDKQTEQWKTEELDAESAGVNYATTTFDPISVVWNASEASICSEYCLRMLKNKIGNCQTALWKNFECRIYSFNSSNVQLEDLNAKPSIKGYTLKEQEGTLSSLLLKFKSVNYTEKFRQIRHLGPFLNPLRGRRAHETKIVEKPEDCFESCLEKWTSAAITKQRRLCRFVTIRNISETELECALYSHNATQSLQSTRATFLESMNNLRFDKPKDESTVASWNGSIYHTVNWSLPLPVASSNIRLHKLDHLGDCLAECDNKGSNCLAMLAQYSDSNDDDDGPPKIVKCYTIGDGDYTPAESVQKKGKAALKMFVKVTNVDAEMRQAPKQTKSNDRQSRSQNVFISLLKYIAEFEKQQQLAKLFNSL